MSEMTKQASFSELEYAAKKKQTRRDRFLAEIEVVTPWTELERAIIPFYPSLGGRGRPPIGLTRMLRMYVAQQCFGLSDEGVEDALYDSQAIRRFVGIDLAREAAPDATTLLKFRRLLEAHQLTESIFNAINAHLAEKGLLLREGTIVDATLIAAPPSTKNREGKRDEEMHQAKKGNQWHFGMKAHIGVDAESGLIHTVECTTAKVADITMMEACLHGEEEIALGDRGYHKTNRTIEHFAKEGDLSVLTPTKKPAGGVLSDEQKAFNRMLSAVRAIVEHPFRVVKRQFGFVKVRYRGLAKNTGQIVTLFALANLWLARKRLLPLLGEVRP